MIDESPGVALARLLGEAGHEVYVYDPVALDAALALSRKPARAVPSRWPICSNDPTWS